MDFGKFLRRSGLTHREVAEKLNCSTALVSSWATNRIQPSFEKIVQLIDLGLTTSELFGEKAQILSENAVRAGLMESPEELLALSNELTSIKERLSRLETIQARL